MTAFRRELLNHPFQYVFDGNPKLIDIISRCIESNHSIIEHNTTYNGIDFIRNINFSARPLISGDGLVVGVIIIIENITEELRVRNMFKRYVSEAIVDQIIDNKLDKFDYPIIILLSILGMFFMVSANDLILFFKFIMPYLSSLFKNIKPFLNKKKKHKIINNQDLDFSEKIEMYNSLKDDLYSFVK